ncbi:MULTISPECIES: histidine phosphatase family protein [Corynebacterium]|uniref:Histidine phosphatase family protein n=2 Tax=Corynebacterium glucuronolyticum TaxID=39791 RepID=A0A7T4JVZ8_9CORY|nr:MULTISPECIES: histidine phosphatase family protein [Corynebacterium]EEI26881.1 phosphoglycerate mutase family protein [Corynebacterium glucuronolyticum ATCC 51867]EEI62162.1 phosphoglycerate mutase family protein [Corynebacterium glucuronolyticum ATCC 51866]MCT1441596.1 histidine phosphatase family protein [Corynebacterium glucuronolyticum]MCT1562984.1 histidine phosphatase family protein [Corynebacterium glucuronolyticum]OFO42512.1 phosphoglycerate mutase [Corynebacterium sp. HMSC073D01]
MRLILLRHGETEWNLERRVQGHLDSPLTQKGLTGAYASAAVLANRGITEIYASDLGRAWSTAQIVGKHVGLPVHADVRLRETNLGAWQGKTYGDLPEGERLAESTDPSWAPDGGESRLQVAERMSDFAQEMSGKKGTILAVTHGNSSRILVTSCLGIDESLLNVMTNTAWATLDSTGWWSLVEWNMHP